jgi:SAM-dependent methyltransferase
MENKLEQLTGANKRNYDLYLQRMTQSIFQSSKGLIPFFAAQCKKILDVGCGSGILMQAIKAVNPDAKIVGIDINQSAVDTCVEQGLDVRNATLSDLVKSGETFDCVIFSSVLHEFSSYDEKAPFTEKPIEDAIADASKITDKGGFIIIRDGIRVAENGRVELVKINFKNQEDANWIERFKKEFPDYHESVQLEPGVLSKENAKEFLYTFTWGDKSWPREVQERFGIMTIENWEAMARRNGFDVKNLMISAEEYKKYLKDKIEIDDVVSRLLEETTMLLVAEKM